MTSTDETPFGHDYWEDRYAAPGLTWSGNPNPLLVTEAANLVPGRALDIGSGEGGDAQWLAAQGWDVTGVDIATNALDKARARVEAADAVAAARIRWEQHDVTSWTPPALTFDLVSSQFMHLADPERGVLFRGLARAVAPGGTLLIVGHDGSNVESDGHRAHLTDLMFTVDDVVQAIAGEGVTVLVAETRERPGADHGSDHSSDVIVRAIRAK
jgi:SAM-dependent methyltransferase